MLRTHYRQPIDWTLSGLRGEPQRTLDAVVRGDRRRRARHALRRMRSMRSPTISTLRWRSPSCTDLRREEAGERADRRQGLLGHPAAFRSAWLDGNRSGWRAQSIQGLVDEGRSRSHFRPRRGPQGQELRRSRPHPRRAGGDGHHPDGCQGSGNRRAGHRLGGQAVMATARPPYRMRPMLPADGPPLVDIFRASIEGLTRG